MLPANTSFKVVGKKIGPEGRPRADCGLRPARELGERPSFDLPATSWLGKYA